LLQTGAAVTVVTPDASPRITVWAREGVLQLLRRDYHNGDLEGAGLVIAATGDTAVNQRVYNEGVQRRLLINVVDSPAQCNYITPSVIRRGQLLLAISTQGIAPALAAVIRRYLDRQLDERVSAFLEQAALWRNRLRREESSVAVRRERWRRLVGRAAPVLLGVGPRLAANAEICRSSLAQEDGRKMTLPASQGKTAYLGSVGFDLLTGRIEDLEVCQAAFAQEERTNRQLAKLQHRSGKPLLEGWVVVAEREFAEVFYQTPHARLARRALCAYFERQLEPRRLPSYPVSYSGIQAINHLFRVACGLHSAVPLETEVHGVLRRALIKAGMNQTLSVPLEQAFRAALAHAGRVRNKDSQRVIAPETIHALIGLAAARVPRFGSCWFAIAMESPWARAVQHMLISQGVATSRILLHDPWRGERLAADLLAGSIIEARGPPPHWLVLIVDGSKGTPRLPRGRLRALLSAGVARLWVLDAGIPRVLPEATTDLRGVTAWDLTDLIDAHTENGTRDAEIAAVRAHISRLAGAYHDRYLARPKHG
jgi:siroheme synthase-like protein